MKSWLYPSWQSHSPIKSQWNSAYKIGRWRRLIFPRTYLYEVVLSIFGKIFIFQSFILLYKRWIMIMKLWNYEMIVQALFCMLNYSHALRKCITRRSSNPRINILRVTGFWQIINITRNFMKQSNYFTIYYVIDVIQTI